MRCCPAQVRYALVVVAGLAMAACATQPDPLRPARERLATANADADIRTYAAASLAEAHRSLVRAAQTGDTEERDHLIYMTNKNLDIAQAIVAQRRAAQQLKGLQTQASAATATRAQPRRKVEQLPLDGANSTANVATRKVEENVRSPANVPLSTDPLTRLKDLQPGQSTELSVQNLAFESGESRLSRESKSRLEHLTAQLRSDPSLNVLVEGHTDDVGSQAENLRISLSRADAVKAFLVEGGITSNRIQTIGLGEKDAVASNATEAGRAQNRRIEFVIYRNVTAQRPG